MTPKSCPLKDLVFDVRSGFASGTEDSDGVFQFRMNNITAAGSIDLSKMKTVPRQRNMRDLLLSGGDVLFNATNSPDLVGKTAYFSGMDREATFSNHFMRIRTNPERLNGRYLSRYLGHLFKMGYFKSKCRQWVNQASISREFLLSLNVPLVALVEQQRIADMLEQVDTLRRKQQAADQCADDLISSAMHHIVGPFHPHYNKWPEASIEDLADPEKGSMRTGPFGSALKHSEFVDKGVAVLGIDNAVRNRFSWDERRFITEEKYRGLERYRVNAGDVIVTIMGTCGRSAVVPGDIPLAITTKHLASITVDRTKCLPEYLSNAIHRHPSVLAQIAATNRGAIMSGLNLGIIRKIKVRRPPMSLQQKFEELVRQTRSLQEKSSNAIQAADDLFRSLSVRYFG